MATTTANFPLSSLSFFNPYDLTLSWLSPMGESKQPRWLVWWESRIPQWAGRGAHTSQLIHLLLCVDARLQTLREKPCLRLVLVVLALTDPSCYLYAPLPSAVPIGPPSTIAEPTPVGVYADEVTRAMDNYQRVMQHKGIPRGMCKRVSVYADVVVPLQRHTSSSTHWLSLS